MAGWTMMFMFARHAGARTPAGMSNAQKRSTGGPRSRPATSMTVAHVRALGQAVDDRLHAAAASTGRLCQPSGSVTREALVREHDVAGLRSRRSRCDGLAAAAERRAAWRCRRRPRRSARRVAAVVGAPDWRPTRRTRTRRWRGSSDRRGAVGGGRGSDTDGASCVESRVARGCTSDPTPDARTATMPRWSRCDATARSGTTPDRRGARPAPARSGASRPARRTRLRRRPRASRR